jgi:GAF domain-containing protein/DNA-binding protein Fis
MCAVHTTTQDLALGLAAAPDSRSALAALLQAAVAAAGADSAKVFLLDAAGTRFWLRASTPDNERWIDRYTFEVGHGLSSWTVLNRASATLHEDPEDDPRYFVDPDLGCIDYQSVATVPLAAPSGRVLGVLMLDAARRRAFTPDVLAAVEPLAALAAAGVEAAEGRAEQERVAAALALLAEPLDLAADEPPTRLLHGACEAARLAAGAALAVVLPERLAPLLGLQVLSRTERGELLPQLDAEHLVELPALTVAAEGIALACLGCGGPPAPLARETLLAAARTASLLLERRRLAEQASAGSAEAALVEALRAGEEGEAVLRVRARRLGIDLAAPLLAVALDATDDDALAALLRDVRERFPAAACAVRPPGALLLLPAGAGSALEELLAGTGATAGTADPSGGYAAAFADAVKAARIGRVVGGPGRVTRAEELGAQRYLYRLAQEPPADQLELRLQHLRERDPELFETVEQLVEANGNRALAAARLHVHRNTLRQRLARIARDTGIDVADAALQFDLQMALRLLRFRRLLREP